MLLHTSNTFVNYNYPLNEAEMVFLGVPFSSTSYSASSRLGPLQIREALKLTENVTDKKWCDVGDLQVVPGSYEITKQRIIETIKEIREANQKAFLIVAGGEHLITLPMIEALMPKTIVQIDAHSDTKKSIAGNEFSHQTWAYHASKLCKIIQTGVTAWSAEEKEFVSASSCVHAIDSQIFLKSDVVVEEPVHLSVDIDCLAGASTGYPEGTMNMKTLLKIINKVRCKSVDIVEICSEKALCKSAFDAARIIKQVVDKL